MNKTFSYIVTKNYFKSDSSDNVVSNIMGVFHNKQDAISFVDKLMEEYEMESGIKLKSSCSDDNNSDAKIIYFADFIYKNEDKFDPNFGEYSKIIYNIDRYEIK